MPLRYGDVIEMKIDIGRVGTTSVEWLYELSREGSDELCATARTVPVASDLERVEKREVPSWLRDALAKS